LRRFWYRLLVLWMQVSLYAFKAGLLGQMMMIIAFVTIKSSLVPLIEGLCAKIYYFRFEIIGGLR